jgi:hypothetical protein
MEAQIRDSLMFVAELSKRERKRTVEGWATAARKSWAKRAWMAAVGLGERWAGLDEGPGFGKEVRGCYVRMMGGGNWGIGCVVADPQA